MCKRNREDVPVEIDFGNLFKVIKKDNRGIADRAVYRMFICNAGYYLAKLIGYDPYDEYVEMDGAVERIIYDFGGWIDENGIN